MRDQSVDRSPSKSTLPASLCSVPQMQLTRVLLPEPFGPIRPSRSPCSTVEVDFVERDKAAEPLAQILVPGALARHGLPPPFPPSLHQSDQAVRSHDDKSDQQQADDQQVDRRGDRDGGDLLDVPSSSAPTNGPSQVVVPPIIGMAIELTA